jgi:hypothetical protein
MAGFTKRVATGLSERLASAWVLLSDTTNFLSRTSVFAHYESQLRDLRQRLANSKDDPLAVKGVKKELTELRAALRIQGYDLSLGALELSIKGFRNDAAVVEGFRRIVIFIGKRDLWYITGDDNHQALHDFLEAECDRRGISNIEHKHYLWFRWNHGLLIISGADSERAEDFETLRAWGGQPENRLLILGRLKKAR